MKTTLRIFIIFALFLSNISISVAQNPLCIIGDATRYGWDKSKSSPMTQDGVNPSKFYYSAYLNTGNFKFLKQNSDWVPSWNKGASDTQVLKRPTYGDPDVSFYNATPGNYSIVLDTTALTLSVTPMAETTPIPFNTLFIVGGASPNGWDLGKATELVRNPTNPFEFSYSGALSTGEFKFPVNRDWGWGQDFFMRVSDTQMVLQNSPDSKWNITTAGNYSVILNVKTLSINIGPQTTTTVQNAGSEKPYLISTMVANELKIDNNEAFNYSIFSLTGSILQKGYCSTGIVDVTSLSKGIYLFNAEGKTARFIKL